jgi:hypothetical protein
MMAPSKKWTKPAVRNFENPDEVEAYFKDRDLTEVERRELNEMLERARALRHQARRRYG